ncbi:MAG: hypothetical protein Kow00102_06160 [Spirochaetota bacterium]
MYIDESLESEYEARAPGYSIIKQMGSHIRSTTNKNGNHYITLPAHKTFKIGTL